MRGQPTTVPDDGLTTRQRRKQALVIVNTGDGKGKTTAALGLGLRGWAQGWSVGVFQFTKSAKWRIGEEKAYDALAKVAESGVGGPITWERMGTGWTWTKRNRDVGDEGVSEAENVAQQGWLRVKELLAAEAHTVYILDEFTYPMNHGWIDIDDVVETLTNRPGYQHVVITGRRCPQQIIDIAQLCTEMTKVAHPFDQGIKGQAGIEW